LLAEVLRDFLEINSFSGNYYCNMSRVISNSLSPNVEADDVKLARKILFRPWMWKKGRGFSTLEEKLKMQLSLPYVFLVNSGRTALEVILESLSIGRECEVITQGFTCNAQINPIRWSGAIPIYADIDDTLNIDPESIQNQKLPQKQKLF